VLIVCEGSKTEPQYFEEIRLTLRVPGNQVAVMPSRYGTSPLQVVEYARDYFRDHDTFEWVFAVFDRDTHDSYAQAIRKAQHIDRTLTNTDGENVRFLAIPSVPCFELWPLLHFQLIEHRANSRGVLETLQQHLPGYTKGMATLYAQTEARLDQAKRHAERLRMQFAALPGDDPYTDVDQVLERLLAIKASSRHSR
jgi:hypothetical protein